MSAEPTPVPPHLRDQIDAVARDGKRALAAYRDRTGARERGCEYADLPVPVRRIVERFEAAQERRRHEARRGGIYRACPHKSPERAEPTHWFAGVPDDVLFCARCANEILRRDYGDHCDVCERWAAESDIGDPTVVSLQYGHITVHMSLCDEGADAPYRVAP